MLTTERPFRTPGWPVPAVCWASGWCIRNPTRRKGGGSRRGSTAISGRRSWPKPPTRASSRWTQLNDLFAAWAGQVANRRVHAETGQTPIGRFEAAGPPRQAEPGPAARGVPLVGDPPGHPHRHRPAGRQRLRRRPGAGRPAGRAAVRPRGPHPHRGVPGRQARRGRDPVHHPPARAPRRPAGRPPGRRTRPGSTTSAWSPPRTRRPPAPEPRSTSPLWAGSPPANPARTRNRDRRSSGERRAVGGALRPVPHPVRQVDPRPGPVPPSGPRRGDRPDQLLRGGIRARSGHRDVGAGKTVALRAAVAGLDPTRHQVIYIANPAFGTRGLYVTIVRALGAQPRYLKAELMAQASDLLAAETAERHRRVVVICDESHLLQPDQLEELRLLTNSEMDSASPFAAILAGQPTLNRQLRMGMFAALDQRIATRFVIKPMDLAESAAYLRHHLKLAGRDEPLFADDAIARLHRVANGLPRALNNAAIAALIAAAAVGQGPHRRRLRQESRRRAHPGLTMHQPRRPAPPGQLRPDGAGPSLMNPALAARVRQLAAQAEHRRVDRRIPRPPRHRPASPHQRAALSKQSTRSPACSAHPVTPATARPDPPPRSARPARTRASRQPARSPASPGQPSPSTSPPRPAGT